LSIWQKAEKSKLFHGSTYLQTFYSIIVSLSLYFLDDGCASLSDGDQSFSRNIKYLEMKWYETPSVVKFAGGKFYVRIS